MAKQRDEERVQKQREEYWQKVRNIPPEKLIFIDEIGTDLAMIRLYARAKKGERARGKRPKKRGKRVSTIGALGYQGMIISFNISGTLNRITFEAFVSRKLVPKLKKGDYVILDNCTSHTGEEIEKMIKKAGAQVIYLPPYSPDFSPIENCWSKVKSILRTVGARTYKALEAAIEFAISQVTQEDIHNWFTHCCYCTSSF